MTKCNVRITIAKTKHGYEVRKNGKRLESFALKSNAKSYAEKARKEYHY